MSNLEIIETTNQRLSENPWDLTACLEQAEAYLRMRKFSAAAHNYYQAIQTVTHTELLNEADRSALLATLYLQHSRALLGGGDLQAALDEVDKVLAVDENHLPARLQAAQIWERGEQWQDALNDLEKAATLSPDQAHIHADYARVLWRMGDAAAALETLGDALEQYPQDASLWVARGQIYMGQGNLTAAKQDFLKAVKVDKTYAPAYPFLTYFAYTEGRASGAEQILTAGFHYDPENIFLNQQAGWFYLSQQAWQSAYNHFTTFIENQEDAPQERLGRAYAAYQLGQIQDAEVDLFHAKHRAPQNPDLQLGYAYLALATQQWSAAQEALETAMRLRPDDLTAHRLHAELIKQGGVSLFADTLNQQPETYTALTEAWQTLKTVIEAHYGAAQIGENTRWQIDIIPFSDGEKDILGLHLDMLTEPPTTLEIWIDEYYRVQVQADNPTETTSPLNPTMLKTVITELITDGQFLDPTTYKKSAE